MQTKIDSIDVIYNMAKRLKLYGDMLCAWELEKMPISKDNLEALGDNIYSDSEILIKIAEILEQEQK
jgi:hypothetical protein